MPGRPAVILDEEIAQKLKLAPPRDGAALPIRAMGPSGFGTLPLCSRLTAKAFA